jgi:signal transduction histidine kinase
MKQLLHTKKLILPAILFIAGFCVSQNQPLDTLRSHMSTLNISETSTYLQKIDTTTLKDYDKALWYFYNGLNYKKLDKHDLGFKNLFAAEKLFYQIDSIKDGADTDYEIVVLLSHQNNLEISSEKYLDKYIQYAKSQNDTLALARTYSRIAINFMQADDFKKSKTFYIKSLYELEKIKDTFRIAAIEMNVGTLYYSVKKDADSALYYFDKTLPIFQKYNKQNYISYNYNNQAKAYELKGNYKKALELYQKTKSIPLDKYDKKTRIVYYENMASVYDSLKDYKNVALYLNKFINLRDSINNEAQNIAISEINTKYQTAEKDKEIAEEKAKNIEQEAKTSQKNSQLIISLIVLALVIISAYLIQKNTRKKQLLAEQAKDLEAQKVSTLLKEQELASIDAMIEGQEKERKRIAGDLHDDLGALMATVKLHFDNIETAQNEEAVTKTSSLLDEAYEKIRTIAHAKNAGVIANQGLLVAVTNMASKISSANTINMEVIAHGLEERLENSLELSLFRMIQELIANIIKHAEATTATIQLTQHEKNLNIIVEDNGKGFDAVAIKNTGIGLQNIKKRIKHLNGKLDIDSTLGKGTTILVDIPLT